MLFRSYPTYLPAHWDPAYQLAWKTFFTQVLNRYDLSPTSPTDQRWTDWANALNTVSGTSSYTAAMQIDFTRLVTELQFGGWDTDFAEPCNMAVGTTGFQGANVPHYQAAGYKEIYRRFGLETMLKVNSNLSQQTRLNFWYSNNPQSIIDTSLTGTGTTDAAVRAVLYPSGLGVIAGADGYTCPSYTPNIATSNSFDANYGQWLCYYLSSFNGKIVFGSNNLGSNTLVDPTTGEPHVTPWYPGITFQYNNETGQSGLTLPYTVLGSFQSSGSGSQVAVVGGTSTNSYVKVLQWFGSNPGQMLSVSLELDQGIWPLGVAPAGASTDGGATGSWAGLRNALYNNVTHLPSLYRSITIIMGWARNFLDSEGLTDAANRTVNYNRVFNEAMGVTDTAIRTAN